MNSRKTKGCGRYVYIWVRGNLIGVYLYASDELARAACARLNVRYSGRPCTHTVETEEPYDPAMVESRL